MTFEVVTLFPEYFDSPLKVGLLGKAIEKGLVRVNLYQLRDFAEDKHRTVDDKPFGGGEGMLLKPEPLIRAVEALRSKGPCYVVYLSPQGRPFRQEVAEELFERKRVGLLCGRYEGIDERVRRHFVDDEISIGDYVIFGGEAAALVVIEAVARLVPGVVGCEDSVKRESFRGGLLKHPQYTRPRELLGLSVPEVLLSGNHAEIERYRRRESLRVTLERRPDLLRRASLLPEDYEVLSELKRELAMPISLYVVLVHYPVINREGKKIASSFTNLDLHDIARVVRTYGLKGYYIVQPLSDQRRIMEELLDYWIEGRGAERNPDRAEALRTVRIRRSLSEVLEEIEREEGSRPVTFVTDARPLKRTTSYEEAKRIVFSGVPCVLLFGTAWGLSREVVEESDHLLPPVLGRLDDYNHLSVRSAASIIIDRLVGEGC